MAPNDNVKDSTVVIYTSTRNKKKQTRLTLILQQSAVPIYL